MKTFFRVLPFCGLLLLVVSFAVVSCGPNYKLRRAKLLTAEAVAEGAVIKHDTVYITKTDTVKGAASDFGIEWLGVAKEKHDTTIYKNKISIRYVYKHDTLNHIIVRCPDSIVKRKIAAAINNLPEVPQDNTWRNATIGLSLIVVLLIVLLGMFVRKMYKS